MARRTKSDAEQTKRQLLAEAKTLFTEKGYADATITEICARSGHTKGALFHHFSNKGALFREVWTGLQTEMDGEARAAAIAARSRDNPYGAFLAGCKVYLKWATREDYQKIVLVDGPSVLGMAGWYESDHDLGSQNVTAGVRYLAKKGIVAEHRVQPLSIMLQSSLNGSGFALSRGTEGLTPDSVFDAFETLVKSLH